MYFKSAFIKAVQYSFLYFSSFWTAEGLRMDRFFLLKLHLG